MARPAKQVCRACEVRAKCLRYAHDHNEPFGIWGGLSERERRRLQRRTAPAVVKACPRHALPLSSGPVVFDFPVGHAVYAAELPGDPRQRAA